MLKYDFFTIIENYYPFFSTFSPVFSRFGHSVPRSQFCIEYDAALNSGEQSCYWGFYAEKKIKYVFLR